MQMSLAGILNLDADDNEAMKHSRQKIQNQNFQYVKEYYVGLRANVN